MTAAINPATEGRTFEALENYVVLRMIPPEKKTAGGIIITEEGQVSLLGEVVKVGPGRWHTHGLVPVNLKPGDVARIGEWVANQPLEDIGGEKLLVVKETDILGKWVKEDNREPVAVTESWEKPRRRREPHYA